MKRVQGKHIPQRTCIACRQIRDKKYLIRLVRAESGAVEIDASAKKPGRGAYLCPKRDCWNAALRSKHLEYALRTKLSDENLQALIDYGNSLPEEVRFE
jgi:uncharacterized protein